ncbi:heme-binding protein [Streptomyces sp. NPDC057486]|uniref:GlcG/HbpS family heme-binding protein n=1 Tax=Streptomyces sp. NPDC057486 TaxID=3346145 RepID=UPI003680CF08
MTGAAAPRRVVDLATAGALCDAAVARARRQGVLVSVAVVDAGGNLVAFQRMDGAEIAGTVLATDKAYTAVANSIPTHELAALSAPGGPLYGLQAAAGGRFVVFGGGVPLREGTHIVGAVGVSGASDPADDVVCAEAAVAKAWEAEG